MTKDEFQPCRLAAPCAPGLACHASRSPAAGVPVRSLLGPGRSRGPPRRWPPRQPRGLPRGGGSGRHRPAPASTGLRTRLPTFHPPRRGGAAFGPPHPDA